MSDEPGAAGGARDDRSADGPEHLELAHHHPGRLRVRARAFGAGGEPVVDRVRAALEALPGISAVTHSPRTGGLLILYEAGLAEPDAILGVVADTAGIGRPLPDDVVALRRTKPALVAIDVTKELNEITYQLTGGRADLRTVVPAAMMGMAAVSFLTSKDRMPRWDNLAYWSFNIFTFLHRREIEESGGPRRDGPDEP